MFPSRLAMAIAGPHRPRQGQQTPADTCVTFVVFIHLLDLAMTAMLASTVGLWEANPIAVVIAKHTESLGALLMYKCIMTLPAICVLTMFRHNHAFRLVLIGMFATSAALAFDWWQYVVLITSVDLIELHRVGHHDWNFIQFR